MDIRCPNCTTLYEFDESRLGPEGVNLRCSACSHVFRVRPAATSAAPWRLKSAATGEILAFGGLTTLQRWIVERKAKRDDEISRSGDMWKPLGEIAELAAFFRVADEIEAADAAARRPDRPTTSPGRPVRAPDLGGSAGPTIPAGRPVHTTDGGIALGTAIVPSVTAHPAGRMPAVTDGELAAAAVDPQAGPRVPQLRATQTAPPVTAAPVQRESITRNLSAFTERAPLPTQALYGRVEENTDLLEADEAEPPLRAGYTPPSLPALAQAPPPIPATRASGARAPVARPVPEPSDWARQNVAPRRPPPATGYTLGDEPVAAPRRSGERAPSRATEPPHRPQKMQSGKSGADFDTTDLEVIGAGGSRKGLVIAAVAGVLVVLGIGMYLVDPSLFGLRGVPDGTADASIAEESDAGAPRGQAVPDAGSPPALAVADASAPEPDRDAVSTGEPSEGSGPALAVAEQPADAGEVDAPATGEPVEPVPVEPSDREEPRDNERSRDREDRAEADGDRERSRSRGGSGGSFDDSMERGRSALDDGDTDAALSAYSRASELRPDSVEAHVGLARTYAAMGRRDLAIARFERALELNSRYLPALVGLGDVLRRDGNTEGAIEAYERVLTITQSGSNAERARRALGELRGQ